MVWTRVNLMKELKASKSVSNPLVVWCDDFDDNYDGSGDDDDRSASESQ